MLLIEVTPWTIIQRQDWAGLGTVLLKEVTPWTSLHFYCFVWRTLLAFAVTMNVLQWIGKNTNFMNGRYPN